MRGGKPMTAAEFRIAQAQLGLSVRAMARFYGVNKSTLQIWRKNGPSPPAARFTLLALALERPPNEISRMMEGVRL